MMKLSRRSRVSCAALAIALAHSPSLAQTGGSGPQFPYRTAIDGNGVNLASGQVVLDGPKLSIGGAGSSLDFSTRIFSGRTFNSVTHNFNIYAVTSNSSFSPIPQNSSAAIVLGHSQDNFQMGNVQGTNSFSANNSSNSTFFATYDDATYTYRDGTKIMLSRPSWQTGSGSSLVTNRCSSQTSSQNCYLYSGVNYGGGYFDYIPSKIIKPNGEEISFNYTTKVQAIAGNATGGLGFHLESIKSSFGYVLRFNYDNSFSVISSVYAINYKDETCSNDTNGIFGVWPNPAPSVDKCAGLAKSWPKMVFSSTFSLNSQNKPYIYYISDANSNTTAINFDEYNNVSSIISPGQIGLSYAYNNPSLGIGAFVTSVKKYSAQTPSLNIQYDYAISKITDSSSNYVIGSYGTPVSVSVSNGPKILRSTVADSYTGVIIYEKDALSNEINYKEDGRLGNITEISYPSGRKEKYEYDLRGNVIRQTSSPASNSGLPDIVRTAGYDNTCSNQVKCNQPNWTQDALGNETDYTYDNTTGLLTSVTGPAPVDGGKRPQTRYAYTAKRAYYKNSISQQIVASGARAYVLTGTSVCRTSSGTALTGMLGRGPFALSEDPSQTASCAGNADELKTTVDYGQQTDGVANNLLPVSQTVSSGDGTKSMTTSQAYDSIGNVIASVGPSGASQTTVSHYDDGRRLVGSVSPDPDGDGPRTPSAIKYTYNADGVLTLTQIGTVADQSDAKWAEFTEAYRKTDVLDDLGRVKRSTLGANNNNYAVSDYLYDDLGRQYCTIQYMDKTNWGNQATSCQPWQISGSEGPDRVTQIEYYDNGRVKKVTAAVGTDVVNVMRSQDYNPDGTLAYVVDANGNRTGYTYDGFNRLTKTTFPSSTKGDGTSNAGDYVEVQSYDANGHVLQSRLRDGNTIGFTYDNLGRLVSRTPQTNVTSHFDNPVTYDYNLIGQPLHITRSGDGVILTYNYDNLGHLHSEGQPFGSVEYDYDSAGNRSKIKWSDGFYVTYDYDTQGNVTKIKENGLDSGINLLASYGYDSLGRRTGVTFGNGTSRTYGWDALGRLARMDQSFPIAPGYNQTIDGSCTVNAVSAICYNPSSQISGMARGNNSYLFSNVYNIDRTYDVNGLNQYTRSGTVDLRYDARGNLDTSGASKFGYSKQNELVSAPNVAFYYDPAGRLIEYDTTTSTTFYYSGSDLLAEADSAGNILRRYVPGAGADEPIVWYEGSSTSDRRFLQTDERGSITAITDSSGAPIGLNTYDEFGIPSSNNIGRFGYTGQTWFSEVGLYNYKARWYSPTLGRFMQTDPIGYGDGLNWYNYAGADPINGKDPSGTSCTVTSFDSSCPVGQYVSVGTEGGDLRTGYSNSFSGDFDGITVAASRVRVPSVDANYSLLSGGGWGFDSSYMNYYPNNNSFYLGVSGLPSRSNAVGSPQSNQGRSFWDCTVNHGGWKDIAALSLDGLAIGISIAQPEAVLLPMALSAGSMAVTGMSATFSDPKSPAFSGFNATGRGLAIGVAGYAQAAAAPQMSISAAGSFAGRNWGKFGTGLGIVSAINDTASVYHDYSTCMAGK